jgi:CMP-N,N'-diacetyllegionaminic acid synthase
MQVDDKLVYAIVPARSGSRGVPDKNIRKILGRELISYSIEFARQLKSIDKILLSTDSEKYADIGREYGAEVPFLRSPWAAADTSMEEDILRDLRAQFETINYSEPDIIVWLRPTFLFRNVYHVQECIDALLNDPHISAARTVVPAEPRQYRLAGGQLEAIFNDNGRDMVRRQDVEQTYQVYSTDVFRFKGRDITERFLGDNIYAVITDKKCGFDIDDLTDLLLAEQMMQLDMGIG